MSPYRVTLADCAVAVLIGLALAALAGAVLTRPILAGAVLARAILAGAVATPVAGGMGVRAVEVREEEPIDDRTAARHGAHGDHQGKTGRATHDREAFHVRGLRGAGMPGGAPPTDSSAITSGIGRAADAG